MTQRFHRHLGPAGPLRSPRAMPDASSIRPSLFQDSDRHRANRNLGRGGTLHYVHASEVAFWERPEEPVLAINQSVPQHWDTLVFWESTANGIHNLFHRTWVARNVENRTWSRYSFPGKDFPNTACRLAQTETPATNPEEENMPGLHGLSRRRRSSGLVTRRRTSATIPGRNSIRSIPWQRIWPSSSPACPGSIRR